MEELGRGVKREKTNATQQNTRQAEIGNKKQKEKEIAPKGFDPLTCGL